MGGKSDRLLGNDYVLAIRKWADLEQVEAPKAAAITFRQVAERYMREILPGKATRTQSDNLKEMEM